MVIHNAGALLKGRITDTLSARFHARMELGRLDVSLLRGIEVSGSGLEIYPADETGPEANEPPLIAIQHFSFHSGFTGLFLTPMHVSAVTVEGLRIEIPPREQRERASSNAKRHYGKIKMVVDRIVCDHSELIIGTAKPNKDPQRFELQHIELQDVGPNAPWRFQATLINATPPGEIQASGMFGPWQTASPGDSLVNGNYTFEHANLDPIKGIAGILSSRGKFAGRLNRIVADGTTKTPKFSLDTARPPVPLETEFHAIVDGLTGDTYLQPVKARLGRSSFTTRGAVIDIKGKGHQIDLDVEIPAGHLQDFLDLAVKTRPAVMTAIIETKTHLLIPAGKQRVIEKLRLDGNFLLQNIHFTNPKVQDKVDMLSMRAQGKPEEAWPGAEDVRSQMTGRFTLRQGVLQFSNLHYELPGAQVRLQGVYSLDGHQFEFHGKVDTKANLAQMVKSRWASLLLEPISLFFKKNGAGAEIPVKISGTKWEPKFGLNLFGKDK
jgi:hypothetical protein